MEPRGRTTQAPVVPQESGRDGDAGCWRCSCSPTLLPLPREPLINTFTRTHQCVCARGGSPAGSGESQTSDSNQLGDCQVETNIMASDPQALSEKGALRQPEWVGSTLTRNTGHVLQFAWHTRNLKCTHSCMRTAAWNARNTREVTFPPPLSTHHSASHAPSLQSVGFIQDTQQLLCQVDWPPSNAR